MASSLNGKAICLSQNNLYSQFLMNLKLVYSRSIKICCNDGTTTFVNMIVRAKIVYIEMYNITFGQ